MYKHGKFLYCIMAKDTNDSTNKPMANPAGELQIMTNDSTNKPY